MTSIDYASLWDSASDSVKTDFMKWADKYVALWVPFEDFTTEYANEWKEFVAEHPERFQ